MLGLPETWPRGKRVPGRSVCESLGNTHVNMNDQGGGGGRSRSLSPPPAEALVVTAECCFLVHNLNA